MFKIHTLDHGGYQYSLENNQGKRFLESEVFASEEEVMMAINELRKFASIEENIVAEIDPNGKHFFTINKDSENIVGKSVLYDDIEQRDRCIRYVLNHTPTAEVIKV